MSRQEKWCDKYLADLVAGDSSEDLACRRVRRRDGKRFGLDGSFISNSSGFRCVRCGVLLQIGSNVANDVYDFERGADTSDVMAHCASLKPDC